MITVSIIGVGARGGLVYGDYLNAQKDKFTIVALCDICEERAHKFAKMFSVAKSDVFLDESEFFEKKRSDLLIIASPDLMHVEMIKKAMKLHYHILVEKPITSSKNELEELMQEARGYKEIITVCHVLRYTAMNLKIKEILESRVLGDLVLIDHIEQIAFWHFAHSFVRGNWRNSNNSSPMIMQKCCHDMDLLQYFAGSKCKEISSVGELKFFNKANKPEDSAARCLDCKYNDECAYSAKTFYLDKWEEEGCVQDWPYNVIIDEKLTKESVRQALMTGNYGRCVFDCDNNVADNQVATMTFANGVKAQMRAVAFTKDGGRISKFYCTAGEIVLDETLDTIEIKPFNGSNTIINNKDLTSDTYGHNGGDHKMIDMLYENITQDKRNTYTSLNDSLQSHLMAINAEESRLNDNKKIIF